MAKADGRGPAATRSEPKQEKAATDDSSSRTRILDAALELMSEKGYSGTSISMICRRSGLPPSSTYWHFGSKQGLMTAVVEHGARRWLEALPRWQDLAGEPRERFYLLLRSVADLMVADANPTRLLMLLSLERGDARDPASLDAVRAVRQSAASGFRLAFREIYASDIGAPGALGEELAEFALALADGAFLAYQIDPSTDLRRLFTFLGDAFLALGDAAAQPDHQAPVHGRQPAASAR